MEFRTNLERYRLSSSSLSTIGLLSSAAVWIMLTLCPAAIVLRNTTTSTANHVVAAR